MKFKSGSWKVFGLVYSLTLLVVSCAPPTGFGAPKVDRDAHETGLLSNETDSIFGDTSLASSERQRVRLVQALEELHRVEPSDAAGAVMIASHERVYRTMLEVMKYPFGRVRVGWAAPFAVTSFDGALARAATVFQNSKPTSREAAERWIEDLKSLGPAIIDDRRRIEADAEAGVYLPIQELTQAIAVVDEYGPKDAQARMLLELFAGTLATIPGIDALERERLIDEASVIQSTEIADAVSDLRSALIRQRTRLERVGPTSTSFLPDGTSYFESVFTMLSETGEPAGDLRVRIDAAIAERANRVARFLDSRAVPEGSLATRVALFRQSSSSNRFPYASAPGSLEDLRNRNQTWMKANDPVVWPMTGTHQKHWPERAVDAARDLAFLADGGSAEGLPWLYTAMQYERFLPLAALPPQSTATAVEGPADLTPSWFAANEALRRHSIETARSLGGFADDPMDRFGYLHLLLIETSLARADLMLNRDSRDRSEVEAFLVETTGLSQNLSAKLITRLTIRPATWAAAFASIERFGEMRSAVETTSDFSSEAFTSTVIEGGPRSLDEIEADLNARFARTPAT